MPQIHHSTGVAKILRLINRQETPWRPRCSAATPEQILRLRVLWQTLTARERSCILARCQGMTNAEACDCWYLSIRDAPGEKDLRVERELDGHWDEVPKQVIP